MLILQPHNFLYNLVKSVGYLGRFLAVVYWNYSSSTTLMLH